MAIFRIETEDGSVYKIEAPEGTTDAQAYHYLQSSLKQEQPQGGLSGQVDYTSMSQEELDRQVAEEQQLAAEAEETSWGRDVADVGVGFASGVPKAAGALVSLGSQVPGLHLIADPLAEWLQDVGEGMDEALLSDKQQQINQELSDRLQAAAGELGPDASIGDYVDAMVSQGGEAGAFIADHPGQVFNLVATSLPYVIGGGVAAKGISAGMKATGLSKGLTGVTAGAVGEGAITAGEVTKNIIEKTGTSGEYGTERLAAIPAGITTGLISRAGGRMAEKAGGADIDVLVAEKIAGTLPKNLVGEAAEKTTKGLTRKVVEGTLREAGEETLQSAQEKIFENIGTGEHPLKDVGGETVLGTITGAGQGGMVNVYAGLKDNAQDKANKAVDEAQEQLEAQAKADAEAEAEQQQVNAEMVNEVIRLVENSKLNIQIEGATAEDLAAMTPVEKALYYLGAIDSDPDRNFVSDDGRLQTNAENVRTALVNAIETADPEALSTYATARQNELRSKHSATFPNEKEWVEGNRKTEKEQQRADVMNPETELGQAFKVWKDDPDVKVPGMHDTDEDGGPTDQAFDAFLKDNVEPANQEQEHDAYVQALNEHAIAADVVSKSKQPEVAEEPAAEPTEEVADVAEDLNPFTGTRKVKRAEAWSKAAEQFGEKFEEEDPGLSQLLHSERFSVKAWDKALEAKAADVAKETEVTKEVEKPEDPTQVVVEALTEPGVNWNPTGKSKNRPKFVRWLAERLDEGNLADYIDKDGNFLNNKIAEEVGFTQSGDVTYNKNTVRDILSEVIEKSGYANVDEFLNDYRDKVAAKQKDAVDSLMDKAAPADDTVTVEDEEFDAAEGDLRSAAEVDTETGTVTIGGTKSQTGALQEDESQWLEEKVAREAQADEQIITATLDRHQELLDQDPAPEEWSAFENEVLSLIEKNPSVKQRIVSELTRRHQDKEAADEKPRQTQAEKQKSKSERAKPAEKAGRRADAETGKPPEKAPVKEPKKLSAKQLLSKKNAKQYAKDTLGKFWRRDNPELAEMVDSKDWKPMEFQRRINETTAEAKPVAKAAVDTDTEGRGADEAVLDQMFIDLVGEENIPGLTDQIHYVENEAEALEVIVEAYQEAKYEPQSHQYKQMDANVLNAVIKREIADVKAKGIPKGVSAFVYPVDGKLHAVFVTPNMKTGTERSTFGHEIGVHIGLAQLLSADDITAIADKIFEMAYSGSKSVDAEIARAAMKRVDAAWDADAVTKETEKEEILAYFVDEALRQGIEPKESNIYQKIKEIFKDALERLQDALDFPMIEIKAEDLVSMAFGAARIELKKASHVKDAPIRFGIWRDESGKERKIIRKGIEKALGKNAAYQWDTMANLTKKATGKLKFLHQVIYEHRHDMPTGVQVNNEIRSAEMVRNEIKRSVDNIAVRAREMAADRYNLVNKFIEKATTEQRWPADPGFEHRTVDVDKEFNKDFLDQLSESEQQFIMDVFTHGENMLLQNRQLAKEKGIDSDFFGFAQMAGPYSPLKRFGSHVVILKSQDVLDIEKRLEGETLPAYQRRNLEKKLEKLKTNANHYVVQFFPNAGQANKFRDNNSSKYAFAKATEKSKTVSEGRIPDTKVLEKVFGALKTADLEPSVKKEVESMVEDLYHASLEEANARHSQAKRKGYAGYEQDMIRSFVSHAKAEANMVAALKYGKSINVALAEAKKEAEASGNRDVIDAYNLLIEHYTAMLNHTETDVANAIASANTAWMLTSTLGYHLQNATQPWAVSYPVLAADFNNWRGVQPKLMAGYKIANDIVSYDGKVPFVQDGKATWQTEVDVEGKSPEQYKELLRQLQLMNLLDVGIEQDLSDVHASDTGFKAIDSTTEMASTLSHRLYQLPRLVEAYNRIATAIAAFDMANENPSVMKRKDTTPLDYAIKIVQDTQGDFSTTGAPVLIKWANQHGLTKLAVQYRKFQVMMAWAYVHGWKQMAKGLSKEERAVGRRTLAYLLGHTAVLSGVRGLPAIGKITALYFLLLSGGEDDEDPTGTEGWMQRTIEKHVENEDLAKILTRGLPSVLGIDASMKLSHSNIFDIAPFADVDPTVEGLEKYAYSFFGATGANVANTVRAIEYANDENYLRAAEYAAPKGLRTILESYRLMYEGYSLKNGDIVVTPEKFDTLPLIANALGIPMNQVTSVKWTRGEQYEITEHFKNRQSELRKEYVRAHKDGDRARKEDLKQQWRNLQDAKVEVRYFFHDAPKVLKRSSIVNLIKAPRKQQKREKSYRKQLGTD